MILTEENKRWDRHETLRTAVSYCVGKEGGTVHHRHHAHHASSENEKRTELRDDVLLLLLLMMMHATAVHDRVPQPFPPVLLFHRLRRWSRTTFLGSVIH